MTKIIKKEETIPKGYRKSCISFSDGSKLVIKLLSQRRLEQNDRNETHQLSIMKSGFLTGKRFQKGFQSIKDN